MANLDQTEILAEIWEKIVEFIPQNKKEDAAVTFLETIISDESLEYDKIELIESNSILDAAYRQISGDDDISYETEEEY